MTDLKGKSAIVTGASQGIGTAMARSLAQQGVNVTVCDIQSNIEQVAAEVAGPGEVQGLHADVSKLEDLEKLLEAAKQRFGGVDILVNNAGVWRETKVTDDYDKAVDDWDYVMDTNLLGPLLLSRMCVPHMVERGGGDIVMLSTYYVLPAKSAGTNPPDTDLYNASKWALNSFTQAWSRSLAEHNVRVNGLCMGAVDTPMLRGLFDGDPPADFAATWMKPEQMGQLLVDLLHDGRSGENIGAWIGEEVRLDYPKAAHRMVTG